MGRSLITQLFLLFTLLFFAGCESTKPEEINLKTLKQLEELSFSKQSLEHHLFKKQFEFNYDERCYEKGERDFFVYDDQFSIVDLYRIEKHMKSKSECNFASYLEFRLEEHTLHQIELLFKENEQEHYYELFVISQPELTFFELYNFVKDIRKKIVA